MLHLAVKRNSIELVTLLISNRVHVKAKCNNGFSALDHAAWNSNIELISVLLRTGALKSDKCYIDSSLLSPDFTLNKFYPKYNFKELNQINSLNFEPNKEVHIKVTRLSEYGERYKLFVIKKNTFENKFNLKEYGITLVKDRNKIVIDNLKWNGLAKKAGVEIGDIVSEFKVENLDRPNKAFVYPIALILLFIFGYLNYKRKLN